MVIIKTIEGKNRSKTTDQAGPFPSLLVRSLKFLRKFLPGLERPIRARVKLDGHGTF